MKLRILFFLWSCTILSHKNKVNTASSEQKITQTQSVRNSDGLSSHPTRARNANK